MAIVLTKLGRYRVIKLQKLLGTKVIKLDRRNCYATRVGKALPAIVKFVIYVISNWLLIIYQQATEQVYGKIISP